MQTTKKKPSLIFILVGAVLSGYLGYLINGAWTEGIAFNDFMNRFNEVCAVPFANYYNSNTVNAVAIALCIYAMAIIMYYTSQRNYMPGKEYGTARFENPKQVNKILADKDENFNRILSQNVKMSLDFRRLKLNGNILICGGSGGQGPKVSLLDDNSLRHRIGKWYAQLNQIRSCLCHGRHKGLCHGKVRVACCYERYKCLLILKNLLYPIHRVLPPYIWQ